MAQLQEIITFFKSLQDSICRNLEQLDGKNKFIEDLWERNEGGGGRTRVFTQGAVIEKGGVNFSHVFGAMPEKIAKKLGFDSGIKFNASGVSIVLHPLNPYLPIIHKNIRYFELENGTYWFGGGIDVTPAYFYREDAIWVHEYLKNTCDAFHPEYYSKFKKWCDEYFYLKHRNESRGIGGLFFDRLTETKEIDKTRLFDFVKSVGNAFIPIYSELANRHRNQTWGKKEKEHQKYRRGRYVEFNLIHDAGTKFGLETNGRTESILMSMPPEASWGYCYTPEPGSHEAESVKNMIPQNWI